MSRRQLDSDLTIGISDITLNVREQFGKTVERIKFDSKGFQKDIPVSVSPGNAHREVFDQGPCKFSTRDQMKISLQYRGLLGRRSSLSIPVPLSEVKAKAQENIDGRKTYYKFYKNVEVTIAISDYSAPSEGSHSDNGPLTSTTGAILEICPRFRLLVIGNSGVGKSTLIQKVFGVKDVQVSESSPGEANINQEFFAKDNGLFVLHDSRGLEAGDSGNFDLVKDFITRRRNMEVLKDRLHAVWVCLAIPFARGRLFEAGMEEFFQKRKEILGEIPIVVVLTKLDLLDGSLRVDNWGAGVTSNLEEEDMATQKLRSEFLKKHCINPLTRAAGDDIPWVAVSTEAGYSLEISKLVRTTTSEIERHVKSLAPRPHRSSLERDAPFYVAGMAQRASIEEKVDLIIDLGKKRYWRNLGASFQFSEDKAKDYLLVIHKDIVQAWNFNDPEMALHSEEFKVALLNASDLGVRGIQDLRTVIGAVTPMIGALAPLINEAIGAICALPIAGAILFGALCIEVYRSSKSIVKRFMAYIVDLFYVMEILFVLAPGGAVTSRNVDLARQVYEKSPYKIWVHSQIHDFDASTMILPGGRDAVMETIVRLVSQYKITDREVEVLRSRIRTVPEDATSK